MGELGFLDAWTGVLNDEEVSYLKKSQRRPALISASFQSFSENLRGFLMANDKFAYDMLRTRNGSTKAFRFVTRLRNVGTDELIYRCAQRMRLVEVFHERSFDKDSPLSLLTP